MSRTLWALMLLVMVWTTGHAEAAQINGGGSGGVGSGTVTSVDAATGVETTTGSPITATGTIRGAEIVNAQTGTTYTYLTGDRGKLVTHSNAAAIAGTLPVASASFPSGWYMDVQNRGAGTLTITPTTSTLDGAASLALTTNQGVRIVSDGTNYFTQRGVGGTGSGTVTVVGAGALTSTALMTGGGTTTAQTPSATATMDASGNISTPGGITTGAGGSAAGFAEFGQGTAPSAGTTSVKLYAPTSVTSYIMKWPSASATGFMFGTNSANVNTLSFSTAGTGVMASLAIANNSAGGYSPIDGAATLTNKTLDCAATGNTCTIKQERYFEVAGCNNATAGPVLNLPTTNAAAAACDTGTNQFSAYLTFADAANQSAHGSFRLPTGFTGGIDWMFRYKVDAGTTGAMGWCVQMVRLPTGSAADPAFPALAAGNCTSNTIPGTAGFEGEATISSATCTSCVAGDRVFYRVSRDGAGTAVTDSATGVGRLVITGPAYAVAY